MNFSIQNITKSAKMYWPIVLIILICIGTETILAISDTALFPQSRLRQTVYEYGGFWPGLLRDWNPNYSGQPYLMFVTYGFLHSGLSHLIVNMITLWSAGTIVFDRVGTKGFFMHYIACIVGGGIGFGLLSSGTNPMVGASGALFGLIGAILAWNYIDRFSADRRLWPVLRAVLILIGLNIVLWWAMGGQLAWETHLGGFIAGWIAALIIDPRPIVSEA